VRSRGRPHAPCAVCTSTATHVGPSGQHAARHARLSSHAQAPKGRRSARARCASDGPAGRRRPPRPAVAPRSSALRVPAQGSATVCILMLEGGRLHAANLGDSGFWVLRGRQVVHRSPQQQHAFNWPFQLGSPGSRSDTPSSAEARPRPAPSARRAPPRRALSRAAVGTCSLGHSLPMDACPPEDHVALRVCRCAQAPACTGPWGWSSCVRMAAGRLPGSSPHRAPCGPARAGRRHSVDRRGAQHKSEQ